MREFLKRCRVSLLQIILYGIVVIAANYVGVILKTYVLYALVSAIPTLNRTWYGGIIGYSIHALFPLVITWLAVFVFMKLSGVSDHYRRNMEKYDWIKSLAVMVLPVEILRFIIVSGNIGRFVPNVCFVPWLMFGEGYLRLTGHYHAYYSAAYRLQFGDHVVLAVCCLIYMAIHLGVVAWMYRYFWRVGERERNDLIAHETTLL